MRERDNQGLRQALAQFATGVTIVTTAGPRGEPVGVTANSFNSISLDPPLVLWSLSTAAHSRDAFKKAEFFCVHVLTSAQEGLSQTFASRGADKFGGLKWEPGMGSVPLLDEFVARFQCRLTQEHAMGDHVVFVGEVLRFDRTEMRPLVFHGGRYAHAERRNMEKIARQLGDLKPYHKDRRKGRESNR